MACVNCKKIRSLILHGKMAAAAGLTVETLREKAGVKEPVESTVEGLRTTIVVDADADHRRDDDRVTVPKADPTPPKAPKAK